MPSHALNAYEKQGKTFSEWVWYEEDVALLEGQGVCYYWDYGTASASDKRRGNQVKLPTILNARHFAGVAARAYTANTGGQFIEIYTPGSVCDVLAKVDVVLGTTLRLTCEAGGTYAGYFRLNGFEGEGSVVPLQTITRASTAGLCLARLEEGAPSGLVESVQLVANADNPCMVGGVSYVVGCDVTAGNATFTLTQTTLEGLRKRFEVITTALTGGGNVFNVSLATNGIRLDGSTALADLNIDAVGDEITLEFCSGIWVTRGLTGTSLEA